MYEVLLLVGGGAFGLGLMGSLIILPMLLILRLRKKPLEGAVKGLGISGALVAIGFVIAVGAAIVFDGDEPQVSNPPQVSETVPETEPPVEPEKSDNESIFSEEEALALLKAEADLCAINCAETLVGNMLYDPVSAMFYDEEILDSDAYLRYVVKLTVNASNAFGGRVTNTYICNFRISSEDTSQFSYNPYFGVQEYSVYSAEYRPEDWGTKPDDFTLESVQLTPESVSLKTLLANPADYDRKYVVITDDLRVTRNDLENRKYRAYLSKGLISSLFGLGYDTSFYVDIDYSHMTNAGEWAQLSAEDRSVIRAEGIFRLYRNMNNTGYLEARKLEKK